MIKHGKNYSVEHASPLEHLHLHSYHGVPGKRFMGKNLGLTGCELSMNRLPAGLGIPFVHAHKKNEEVYLVVRGNGYFYVDGEEFSVSEGSVVRVAPEGARVLRAGNEDLYFICIQAEAKSLTQATLEDGYVVSERASWM